MTTTIMRDSSIGDAWIRQMVQMNPIAPVLDAQGQPTGNFTTGPVRLTFPNLFTPQETQAGGEKYNCAILFPPGVDFTPLYQAYYQKCGEMFSEYWNPHANNGQGGYSGLHSPFRDQGEKAHQYSGYTPGCVFMSPGSKFKPPIVDARMNPVVDENRVYAGVWAILSVNAYVYGKSPPQPKKGVSFGMQSVMLVADDDRLGGGAPDPNQQFGGVKVQPPTTAPAMGFGAPGAPGGAPVLPGMPGSGSGGLPFPAPPAGTPAPPPAGTVPATGYPSSEDDMSFMQ